MPFKIVQTKEAGKPTPSLTVVPSAWESNGVLFWPPKRIKNANKLIRDQNSAPECDWDQYPCKIKRDNFLLYESAEAEIGAMSYITDSSDGAVVANNKPRKLCPRLNNPRKMIGRVPQVSFNRKAEQCSYILVSTYYKNISIHMNILANIWLHSIYCKSFEKILQSLIHSFSTFN